MRELSADLHIHTCLSPCAEEEMTPKNIVAAALAAGLDLIAVCDHNIGENVAAVQQAAGASGVEVIGGMEISSSEEVHVLGLFNDAAALADAQARVHENLPGENDPGVFGDQLVMDADDRVVRQSDKLLIGATNLTLSAVVDMIHGLGGVAIASHVDRPSYSVVSQLGFVPEDLGLDGAGYAGGELPDLPEGLSVITSSDAHRLNEIGSRRTRILVERASLDEVGMALRGERDRRILNG